MNSKLTLRLEEELIKSAKNHANIIGKSVSQMVAAIALATGLQKGGGDREQSAQIT